MTVKFSAADCTLCALVIRPTYDVKLCGICGVLRFEPDKVVRAERSSMVTSCVSVGLGISLLTPTMRIDGLVENMTLRLVKVPVTGLSCTLTVAARQGEWRDLR